MFKSILQYLLAILTRAIINKYSPDIVGITGSVGKTSAKEAIAAVLASRFNVRANYKNYNNEIGLPLTVAGVEKSPGSSLFGWIFVLVKMIGLLIKHNSSYPEILVLEMGADKPGDIKYLVNLAPCKVGVITGISHSHTEAFKTIKKIAQEKWGIVTHLGAGDFAVLNFDNQLTKESASKTKAEVISYGFSEGVALRASDVRILCASENDWPVGLNFKISYQGNIIPALLNGMAAEHLVYSALAGLAVGNIFGVNLVDGIEALKKLKPLAGHMRLLPGIKKTLLIDDTYNSSPAAALAALYTLSKINVDVTGKRYAVLGDMLELGVETENAHREVGLKIAELGIDYLITVGEASKYTSGAAREAGLNDNQIASFADSATAGIFLQEKIKPGDVILVKGSQSVRMEKIVKEVMAEPERAQDLLVRQDKEWMG